MNNYGCFLHGFLILVYMNKFKFSIDYKHLLLISDSSLSTPTNNNRIYISLNN
jgi:hypothetical protein